VEVLDGAGIDYMITGSLASSLQGEPRATHDIDLVIQITLQQLPELVSEGDKVDFWLLTDEPFDQMRFSRKYVEDVLGMRLKVSSPEDTILQKLKWAMLSGGGEKAFVDALRVYEVQQGTLDLSYMEVWAGRIGIHELWARLKAEAEPI
jgi:hypothetical protein